MTTHHENRPSPDALLKELHREQRGRLKIFIGAAPGVGKTYAMLRAGHAAKADGIDVVVGIVETHKRAETDALVGGLEVIPRQQMAYRGMSCEEMNLDQILARKPALVLVDELAHTNIPTCRHAKRYLDVEELLDAGIDVYSTINIQHIESLNDIIARITKVQVRETVPDSILVNADEVALIDLPPKELQKRLQEGKVYVPEQARQAMHHFFSQGNLTALRELALRYTAERVDSQMMHYMETKGIKGPSPVRERLMVCIDNDLGSMELVRHCSRMAERQKVPWTTVHVHSNRDALVMDQKEHVLHAMRLTEELGGEVATLVGNDVVSELVLFARSRHVTRVIIGKTRKPRWQWFRAKATRSMWHYSETFELLIIPTDDIVLRERHQTPVATKKRLHMLDYVISTGAVTVAALIAWAVGEVLPLPNLSLIFLSAVLYVAVSIGFLPSIYTTLLSFFVYNFFFTEPRYTLFSSHKEHVLTLIFYALVATVTSRLASKLHQQIDTIRENAERTSNLYAFSQKVASAPDIESVYRAVIDHVSSTIHTRALIMAPKHEGEETTLTIVAGYPEIDTISRGAAEWAWKHGEPAGKGCNTLPAANWTFFPMQTDIDVIGLLGIEAEEESPLHTPEQRQLLHTLTHQAAIAIERATLADTIDGAKIYAETERFRSALLSSISHDFRTPLSSIIGSVTSLQAYYGNLDKTAREGLLDTIHEEAERLNRFVQNLLDMTRYGAGTLEPKKDWIDVEDIYSSAINRLQKGLSLYNVTTEVPEGMPMLYGDFILLEQVVVNLLDNACKYSPLSSTITLKATYTDDQIILSCSDQGKGIPPDEQEQVFNMFYRIHAEDTQAAGIGLGLAICRGIIESHGGTIRATSENMQGTTITLTLPRPPQSSKPSILPLTEDEDDGKS